MKNTHFTLYGTDNPEQLMDKFYQAGSETLLFLRDTVVSPENRKKPRTWTAVEAAKMVGVSAPTFRKLQNSDSSADQIPGIVEELRGKRTVKQYTLKAINALRDKANTRYKRPQGSQALTIAVSNLKGGVGKTETAVDLGKKLAIEGLRALLLDFDAQGTATLISSGLIPDLEIDYDQTITDCLISDPNKVKSVIFKTHFDGFDIIPANLAIQDCDLLLPNEKENNQERLGSPFLRLKEALKIVKEDYDIILIDCGPNLGLLTLNAIVACDGMIIPIPPSMNDYSSFIMYTATLRNMFRELPEKKLDYLRILISKHNKSAQAKEMEDMLRQQFGRYILSKNMCETTEVSRASKQMSTIYDVSKPPANSREAYRRAMHYLDEVNLEIIDDFKMIWEAQVTPKKEQIESQAEGVC